MDSAGGSFEFRLHVPFRLLKSGGDGSALRMDIDVVSQRYVDETSTHRWLVNTYVHIANGKLYPIMQCVDCGEQQIHDY
jgi:hypothetical protein